jgi:ParB-like chromosome segregation protein Spo0J
MDGGLMQFPEYKPAPVANLVPYARNSRTHSAAQVDKIAASIKEFGFLNPVIVDGDNGIIAGHGRILAAQKLGLETVPTIEAAHLTDAQRKAYIIADNRLALDAGWDDDLLKIELQDLEGEGFDLSLTGFDLEELTQLFDEPNFEPGTEEDQGKLDELEPKMVTCPHCAAEWDLREHGQG